MLTRGRVFCRWTIHCKSSVTQLSVTAAALSRVKRLTRMAARDGPITIALCSAGKKSEHLDRSLITVPPTPPELSIHIQTNVLPSLGPDTFSMLPKNTSGQRLLSLTTTLETERHIIV